MPLQQRPTVLHAWLSFMLLVPPLRARVVVIVTRTSCTTATAWRLKQEAPALPISTVPATTTIPFPVHSTPTPTVVFTLGRRMQKTNAFTAPASCTFTISIAMTLRLTKAAAVVVMCPILRVTRVVWAGHTL